MTDPGRQTDEEFALELSKISAEAFALATAAIDSGDFETGKARARELDARLDETWPRIDRGTEPAKSALAKDWTDARMDIGYLLSHGELPTSTRLFHALNDRGMVS
jgi:hypothetical protein